jgi:hypothetical protein
MGGAGIARAMLLLWSTGEEDGARRMEKAVAPRGGATASGWGLACLPYFGIGRTIMAFSLNVASPSFPSMR